MKRYAPVLAAVLVVAGFALASSSLISGGSGGPNSPAAGWTSDGTTTSTTQAVGVNGVTVTSDGGVVAFAGAVAARGLISDAGFRDFSALAYPIALSGIAGGAQGVCIFGGTPTSCTIGMSYSNASNIVSIGLNAGTTIATQGPVTSTGAISSSIASGSNAFAATVNGARFDFGTGASDYASSNGTAVTFAGPLTTASTLSGTALVVGSTNVLHGSAPTLPVACTSPTITNGGQASFQADVGTTCAGVSTFLFTLSGATNGWDCRARHKTVASAATAYLECAGDTTTAITCTNFTRTTGLALAFTDGDDLVISCVGR